MSNIRFSQLPTVVSLKDSDLFAISSPDTSTPPVYTSAQSPISQVAAKIVEGTTFATSLPTTNKTVAGAIQEIYGEIFTGTLTAGSTSITFQDTHAGTTADPHTISNSATFDIYTDTFGVNPTNVTVSAGEIVLTFSVQANDLGVKVRVTYLGVKVRVT